jgi:hypothetical protein
MRRRAAAVGLALVLAVACGADEPARTTDEPGSTLPPEVAALWTIDDPVVAADPPATPWLPGPEAAATLASVRAPQVDADLSVRHTDEPAQTLYLDPAAADPDTARALVVGRTEVSDIEGGLYFGAGDGSEPGEPVDVAGIEGRLVQLDGLVVVGWPNPGVSPDCACDQTLFVAGRGIDADDVRAAAEVADPLAALPALPEAALGDLEPLGTSPAVHDRELDGRPPSQVLEVRDDELTVRVAVVGSDPRLVPHVRFWAPDGALVGHWPRPTVARALDDGTVAVATAASWGDGAEEPIDLATAVPAAEAALADLVPATDADVDTAQEEVLRSVPIEPCDAGPGDQVDIAGATADLRWTVGLTYVDGAVWTCEESALADGSWGGGSGGGGVQPLDLAAPIEVVSTTTSSGRADEPTRWVVGHVGADAATVEVAVPGTESVPAVLADVGPAPDRRWFAAVAPGVAMELDGVATAIARTADGTELGRATTP